jgi:hypothetical protein
MQLSVDREHPHSMEEECIESDPDLDDDQMVIVYLNCYPVHAGEEFRYYMFNRFPYIILCFVPANCSYFL